MSGMVFSKHIYPDNSKIVFENGMYDFDAHKFSKEITKKTVQFSVAPFKYNPFAVCPQWNMFLDSVLPDKDAGYVAGVLGKYLHRPQEGEDRDHAHTERKRLKRQVGHIRDAYGAARGRTTFPRMACRSLCSGTTRSRTWRT